MTYLLVSVFALSLMILLMPLLQRLALHIGAVDLPGARKVHTAPVPRIGGVLIVFTFLLTSLIFIPLTREVRAILAGSMVISAMGLTDDLLGLGAWTKFILQWLTAGLFLAIARPEISLPLLGQNPWLGWPAAAFLMVLLINAINLQDGLDGLAGGLVVIGGLSMGMYLIHGGEWMTVAVLTALIASVVGFLRVNTWPATIFMGDTGSYLLGFVLAAVFLLNVKGGRLPLWTGLCFFAIPLLDTLQVMIRRLLRGQSPFQADRGHLHHGLVGLGLRHDSTVYLEYMLASFMGLVPMLVLSPLKLRWLGVGLILQLLGIFLIRRLLERRGKAMLSAADPGPARPLPRRLLTGLALTAILVLFGLELCLVKGVTFKYGVLPAALSLGYALWSWLRLRFARQSRISITVTLIVATHFFILHQNGFGIYSLDQPLARAWLGQGLALTLISILLFLAYFRRIVLITNPIEYFLVFGAILLFFLPVELKATFSTDLLGVEMLSFFLFYQVFSSLIPQQENRLHALAVGSLVLLLLVGVLR